MPTNFERLFGDRPDVYAAWLQLNGAIKANMDLRRYELVTLAAAQRLRSSYCCLAHGKILLEQFGEPVRDIVVDRHAAGLDEVDLAVMGLADRVVVDATSIDDGDLQRLRDLGLTEAEIMDVVLAASARCFFSKTLDALDTRADAALPRTRPGAGRGAHRGPPDRRILSPHTRSSTGRAMSGIVQPTTEGGVMSPDSERSEAADGEGFRYEPLLERDGVQVSRARGVPRTRSGG